MENLNDSLAEQIHDCDHPICCPKICIQKNLGTVNINSHNKNTSRIDNCDNHNQCWSLLMLINYCPHQIKLSDSVAKDIDPAITDESSRARSRSESLESHGGRFLRTYTIAHTMTTNIPSANSATSAPPIIPTTCRFYLSPAALRCIVLIAAVVFVVCTCIMFVVMVYLLIVLIKNHILFK
jgi:hypothetical protein